MNNKAKKIKLYCLIIGVLSLGVAAYCCFENTHIGLSRIQIADERIPQEFNGYKIVHISDLHNASFGKNNAVLLKKISEASPDAVFITGDLIDSRKPGIDDVASFIENTVKFAPVYFVTGNHEAGDEEYAALAKKLELFGVTVLDNRAITLKRDNGEICLMGLSDPAFFCDAGIPTEAVFNKYLSEMNSEANSFSILLSHRPESFELYAENKIDLVFSGHAHGGQFRLPLIGGVIAPHQGFLPQFTSGVYEKDSTRMIVSRGLGNSVIPIRINNTPEIVVVTLQSQKQ